MKIIPKKFVRYETLSVKFIYNVSFGKDLPIAKIREACQWLNININGKWTIEKFNLYFVKNFESNICFELEEDAVLFSLSWL